MEDVLDVYKRPYDPKRPVVNMDERPVQLVKETREPQPPRPGTPGRYDYEYERSGVANAEALRGWRKLSSRERRTAVDRLFTTANARIKLERLYPQVQMS